MRLRWVLALSVVLLSSAACSQARPLPPAPLPQTSGTIDIHGLRARVEVVRDRWGIPHIRAANQDDLFFAQGFVQAQDRLFQMDLWRRSALGRLSEVLGANFIERDAMTRRVQRQGPSIDDWTGVGGDARAIAVAFTRGINAWVARAREALPEEFALAGWVPEFWRAEDLLNRTDAFLASGDATDEVLRAQLVAAVGVRRADAMMPPGHGLDRAMSAIAPGLDPAAVSPVVAEILRRAGTRPFFSAFARPFPAGSNAWAIAVGENGAPLLATDPHRLLEAPSPRYLVHLQAPGWNVAGATMPWLPGVAIGHNEDVAWGMASAPADTQDIYVERLNPANPKQVWTNGRWVDLVVRASSIGVRGRGEPFDYEQLYTPHGVVVALDRERHLAYVLAWSGFEPGAAAELGALTIGRARSTAGFREALAHWKMPVVEFVYAGRDGGIGRQTAGLVPVRRGWHGSLPVPGAEGRHEWSGWMPLDELPRAVDRPDGFVAVANGSRARLGRIADVLSRAGDRSVAAMERVQQDVRAWQARALVPLLGSLQAAQPDVESARLRLLQWNQDLSAESGEAALYVAWERALVTRLAARVAPKEFAADLAARSPDALLSAVAHPTREWFIRPKPDRDSLVLESLAAAVGDVRRASGGTESAPRWGSLNTIVFAHPLAISNLSRARFNVGPFTMPGYAETILSIGGGSPTSRVGPSFRAVFDAGDWDRSVAINAPGQSQWPGSPHFADLAPLWAAGRSVPFAFSDAAVEANAEARLALIPESRSRR